MRRHVQRVLLVAAIVTTGSLGALAFGGFGEWSDAVRIEDLGPGAHADFNHPTAVDGCPFISPDGKKFFTASTRLDGVGALDTWVSTRHRRSDPWERR